MRRKQFLVVATQTESELRQAFAAYLDDYERPSSQMTAKIYEHITEFLSMRRILPEYVQKVRRCLVLEALRIFKRRQH